jgi:hypothetical protein
VKLGRGTVIGIELDHTVVHEQRYYHSRPERAASQNVFRAIDPSTSGRSR